MSKRIISTILVAILLASLMPAISSVMPVKATQPSGLVGRWHFDEGLGTSAFDSSGNSLTGTISGATWVSGNFGSALNFDGNDYVVVSDHPVLDITGSITIEAWIYPTTIGDYKCIVAKRYGNFANYAFRLNGGKLEFYYSGPSATPGSTDWNVWQSTSAVVSTGSWQYVAVVFTFNGGPINVYRNGEQLTGTWIAGSESEPATSNDYALRIGMAYTGYPQYFQGKIDELRIWSRTLSTEEIKAHAGGLVGEWDFNEASGTTAFDSSGFGNDGTLFNMDAADWVVGRFSTGLDFDGTNDYVSVPDSPSLDISGPITVEAWVKMDSYLSDSFYMVAGKWNDIDGNFRAYLLGISTKVGGVAVPRFYISMNGIEFSVAVSSESLVMGQWYHLAGTFNGDILKIYVNGVERGVTDPTSTSVTMNNKPFLIGADRAGGSPAGKFFDGIIDEVRVWSQVLVPVKFVQTGIDNTSTGTIVTVTDPILLDYDNLPHVVMVKVGSTIYYEYESIVASSDSGKRFVLSGVNPNEPSTTVSAPTTVTGSYNVQLYPIANAGAPYTVDEGTAINLEASASNDPDGSIVSYEWDLDNDGQYDDASGSIISYTWYENGIYPIGVQVTDNDGLTDTDQTQVTVNNVAPTITSVTGDTINENEFATVSGTFTDPGSLDTFSVTIDWGEGSPETYSYPAGSTSFSETHQYLDDNPTGTSSDVYPISVIVTDDDTGFDDESSSVTVDNMCPEITDLTGPTDPVKLGFDASVSVTFTDQGTLDTHKATVNWGDDNMDSDVSIVSPATLTHVYSSAGVYSVSVTITDDDGGSDIETFDFIVVYDPTGGFVTGGGWINSPAGAYTALPELTGKATFGFVSKYLKGASIPTGNTEFMFHVASMNFKSTSYEWLVIAGSRAQYKGSGTIDGAGDYGFILTAIDGQINGGVGLDKFRIKIWDTETDVVLYDNQMGVGDTDPLNTVISGGSIVIHKAK